MTSVFLGERDLSGAVLILPQPLNLTVQSYSHSAQGGPTRATLNASGNDNALWQLFAILRCPVEIKNSHHKIVWWGYVESVETTIDGLTARFGLADLYNKMRCDYVTEYGDELDLAATTGYSTDSASVTKYGTKETILTLSRATSTSAAQYLATELAARKDPLYQETGQGGGASGRIHCRGWWGTLGWRNLAFDSVALASYTTITGAKFQSLNIQSFRVAQSFTVATAKTARALAFYLRCTDQSGGTPNSAHTASLTADIMSNTGSVPNAILRSSAAVTDLYTAAEMHWQLYYLSSGLALSTATTYWAAIRETGSQANPFEIRVDEALGASGTMKTKDGPSAWISRVPNADLPFAVFEESDSMQLVADIAVAMGQFVNGSSVETTSGITFLSAREDDSNVLADIEDICRTGTTNARRILADIRADRAIRVREEPAAGASDWLRVSAGELLDPLGNPVDLSECPAGMWVKRTNPIAGHPVGGGPVRGFVEEATCTVRMENGHEVVSWAPRMRGQPDVFDFSVLRQLGYPVE